MSQTDAIELIPAIPAAPDRAVTGSFISQLPSARKERQQDVSESDEQPLLSRDAPSEGVNLNVADPLTRSQSTFVMVSVTAITAISSLLAGVITVAIPKIASDIHLSQDLLLWPASIFALVAGCTLLLSGSATDILGSRFMYLSGCFLQCTFVLACGLARTGNEMIAFRALSGLANSMCLPSAVSIITTAFATGKRRNYAFAAMGGGQPAGFAIGLTVGGVLTDTIGWRWAFYLSAILTALVGLLAAFTVPKDDQDKKAISWRRFRHDVDWVGAALASLSLAGLSYVLGSVTTNAHRISEPLTASILAVSLLMLPLFSLWVERQTRKSRPALIPNKLWNSRVFTSINLAVFLVWGSFNALEQVLSFYFQYVQKLTALDSALRFLPEAAAGLVSNILIGWLVIRVRADTLVVVASVVALTSPIIMGFATPTTSYWASSFPAILLNPVGADTLFTISNLVITNVFPKKDHGLAGGVFNTVAQVGKSFGLALAAVIANSVTKEAARTTKLETKGSTNALDFTPLQLMQGYRAAFWFCFALCAVTVPTVAVGLRKVGKVGEKKD